MVLYGQLHQWLVHKLPPSCSHQSVWNERCAVWWLCDFLSKPLEFLKSESPIHTFTALVGRATWCFWHGSGIMVWVTKCCKVGFSNFVCKWYPRSFRTLPCLWIQLQYQQTRYNNTKDIKLTLYWKQWAQPKGFSQFSVASKSVGRESCDRRGVLTKQICLAGSNFWKSVSIGTSQPFTHVNSVIKVSLPISWCLCMPPFCVTVATLPNCSSNKRKKRSILFLDSRSILFHTKTLRSTFHSERKIDKTHPAPLKVTSWKAREPMETYQYPSFRISLHINIANIANILRNPMAFWGSQRRGHRRHKVSRWRTLQHFWSSHTRVDVSKERDENYIWNVWKHSC